MTRGKKIAWTCAAALVLAAGIGVTVRRMNQGVVTVQTGRAVRQDLSSLVTASGEIKPLSYSNVMAEGFGKIPKIVVQEGDQVKKGEFLLRLKNIHPEADVDAQRASMKWANAPIRWAKASEVSAAADIE